MKSYSLTLQSLLMLSALAAHGQGTFIYDQQSATSQSFDYGAPIQEQQPTGQSFTPTLSSVRFVQLEFGDSRPGNGVGATVYVNLRADSLTGTVLGSTDPVYMPDGFRYGITNFFFATPVAVTPGTAYYFQPVVQSGDSLWDIINGPYNYPGGTLFANGVPNPNGFDAWFREGVIPEPPSGLLVLAGLAAVGVARRLRRFRARILGMILVGIAASAGTVSVRAQSLERVGPRLGWDHSTLYRRVPITEREWHIEQTVQFNGSGTTDWTFDPVPEDGRPSVFFWAAEGETLVRIDADRNAIRPGLCYTGQTGIVTFTRNGYLGQRIADGVVSPQRHRH
jgi:hypothetical protein